MGDKVYFINTGALSQTGWIIGINNSSYAITEVLKLDVGTTTKMAGFWNSVQTLNGKLYFHLY